MPFEFYREMCFILLQIAPCSEQAEIQCNGPSTSSGISLDDSEACR